MNGIDIEWMPPGSMIYDLQTFFTDYSLFTNHINMLQSVGSSTVRIIENCRIINNSSENSLLRI